MGCVEEMERSGMWEYVYILCIISWNTYLSNVLISLLCLEYSACVLYVSLVLAHTADSHTLFRNNSLASKALDQFMKVGSLRAPLA